jgi:DNA-damage-inducible protein J
MPDTTVTIRVDEEIKRKFEEFCAEVGLNMSVAVNLFIRASLKDRKIPFPIESSKTNRGMALLGEMRAEAEARGFLSDKEIEAEIQAARTELKTRRKK